jgi:hypothetical protein
MRNPLIRLSFCVASFALAVFSFSAQRAAAQSTTEIKEENGIVYRVTKQIIQKPISKTEYDQQQQTVLRERYDTQWHTNYRTYLTPVTEYRQELFLANRWNPLAMPYWTYRYVPVTRWESRAEPYSVPVAQRTLVPEQQTVHVPRTTTQMATEVHESKVALGPASSGGWTAAGTGTSVARREVVGGVKKLD